ncbi:hypothetical protein GCM10020358_08830 [Amorphoplanes nipponensis]
MVTPCPRRGRRRFPPQPDRGYDFRRRPGAATVRRREEKVTASDISSTAPGAALDTPETAP